MYNVLQLTDDARIMYHVDVRLIVNIIPLSCALIEVASEKKCVEDMLQKVLEVHSQQMEETVLESKQQGIVVKFRR